MFSQGDLCLTYVLAGFICLPTQRMHAQAVLQGFGVHAKYLNGAIAYFRHPNFFAYVTPKSLSGPATLCKAVLTEEKLRSLLKDAQRISDRAREKTSLSYIPATSYDLLFLLLVY